MPTIAEMQLLNNSFGDVRQSVMQSEMLRRQKEQDALRNKLDQQMLTLKAKEQADQTGIEQERNRIAADRNEIAKRAKMNARWRNMKGAIREIEGTQNEINQALGDDPPDPKSPVDLRLNPADTWGVGWELNDEGTDYIPKRVTGKVPAEQAQKIVGPTQSTPDPNERVEVKRGNVIKTLPRRQLPEAAKFGWLPVKEE